MEKSLWNSIDRIPGWLKEIEADLLLKTAMSIPDDSIIVEIGCYQGKSTSLLATTGKTIYTIDPLSDHTVSQLPQTTPQTFLTEQLQERLEAYNNVHWLKQYSTDHWDVPASIGLLYIDGYHVYPQPMVDYLHYQKHMHKNGLVAFHDYSKWKGVTRSVDELIERNHLVKIAQSRSMIVLSP